MKLTTIAKCIRIYKKSSSPAFKDMEVGDKILFSCEIEPAGRTKTTYAKYLCCQNQRTGNNSYLSFNQIDRVLKNFEFEELKYL